MFAVDPEALMLAIEIWIAYGVGLYALICWLDK